MSETIQLEHHDPPNNVSKDIIDRLSNYAGDAICFQFIENDNRNKSTVSVFNETHLNNHPRFGQWNDTSVGNLRLIGYLHHDECVRVNSWSLIEQYFAWKDRGGNTSIINILNYVYNFMWNILPNLLYSIIYEYILYQ